VSRTRRSATRAPTTLARPCARRLTSCHLKAPVSRTGSRPTASCQSALRLAGSPDSTTSRCGSRAELPHMLSTTLRRASFVATVAPAQAGGGRSGCHFPCPPGMPHEPDAHCATRWSASTSRSGSARRAPPCPARQCAELAESLAHPRDRGKIQPAPATPALRRQTYGQLRRRDSGHPPGAQHTTAETPRNWESRLPEADCS